MGFTPCKTVEPLQGMQLQEKEAKKDLSIQKIYLERTYLLFIPDLEPYPKTRTIEPSDGFLLLRET